MRAVYLLFVIHKIANLETVSEIALNTHSDEHHSSAPYTSTGTLMGKVFMWLFLCQDALMFMGFFAAYISVRIGAGELWPGPETHAAGVEHYPLNIPLTAINTFVLIISSVTMVMAVQAAHWKHIKKTMMWLGFTIIGGAIFLGIQYGEYYHLIVHDGMTMQRSLFDATFFSLTGFHGIHVFSGVAYLLALVIALWLGPVDPHKKESYWLINAWRLVCLGITLFMFFSVTKHWPGLPHVLVPLVAGALPYTMVRGISFLRRRQDTGDIVEVAGLYWHFVDLIWIILFTLVYLI